MGNAAQMPTIAAKQMITGGGGREEEIRVLVCLLLSEADRIFILTLHFDSFLALSHSLIHSLSWSCVFQDTRVELF